MPVGDELRLVELRALGRRESLRLAQGRGADVTLVRIEVDAVEDPELAGLDRGTRAAKRTEQDPRLVDQRGVGLGPLDLLERRRALSREEFKLDSR